MPTRGCFCITPTGVPGTAVVSLVHNHNLHISTIRKTAVYGSLLL